LYFRLSRLGMLGACTPRLMVPMPRKKKRVRDCEHVVWRSRH
jgi:hypothetical protein